MVISFAFLVFNYHFPFFWIIWPRLGKLWFLYFLTIFAPEGIGLLFSKQIIK
jgi:hypothetical protein